MVLLNKCACVDVGCGRTRYQSDNPPTATITTPTMMDGRRVDAGIRFLPGWLVDQCRKDIRARRIAQQSAKFGHVQMRAAHRPQYMSEPHTLATVGAVVSCERPPWFSVEAM
jgi:hypothetical protein